MKIEYEYVGGGYFREKGVPKGLTANTLHGMQMVEYVLDKAHEEMAKLKEEIRELKEELKDLVLS